MNSIHNGALSEMILVGNTVSLVSYFVKNISN